MNTKIDVRFGLPPAQGLYDPQNEHDACGMGFVASVKGTKTHDIVLKGIEVLANLEHRGACGCDPETGDGAGILIQIPHTFFVRECARIGIKLPNAGEYGVGMVFLPQDDYQRRECEVIFERIVKEEGMLLLGWRDTPVESSVIGRVAASSQPRIRQIFLCGSASCGVKPIEGDALERKLYMIRKRTENEVYRSAQVSDEQKKSFYICSLSARTIVYKGLLLAPQIARFYTELNDADVVS